MEASTNDAQYIGNNHNTVATVCLLKGVIKIIEGVAIKNINQCQILMVYNQCQILMVYNQCQILMVYNQCQILMV